MDNLKTSVVERLKSANNVLVTVPTNPSVDQLAAAIGVSLFLNKLGKHATAVFSGAIPPVLEFLKPEETFEKNTDSLRDFIIALDRSKADKLRYKVEDKLVKIFITPYRVSLSQDDLEFSQGDFNVDVVLALGVQNQRELDQAVTAHGRILHDATVITLNTNSDSQLGLLNWTDPNASSLCEMVTEVCEGLQADSFDSQIATALLTGIVAATQRFSNTKTTSNAMTISARLMAAGANQQLVATSLEQKLAVPGAAAKAEQKPANNAEGELVIERDTDKLAQVNIDEQGNLRLDEKKEKENQPQESKQTAKPPPTRLVTEPPVLGGTLTASGKDRLDPSIDPLGRNSANEPLLSHDAPPAAPPAPQSKPPGATPSQTVTDKTLKQVEELVNSPHVNQSPDDKPAGADEADTTKLDEARKAVEQVVSATSEEPPAAAALDDELRPAPDATAASAPLPDDGETGENYLDVTRLDAETGLPLPDDKDQPLDDLTSPKPPPKVENPGAPPPVPPPILPEPLDQTAPTFSQNSPRDQ